MKKFVSLLTSMIVTLFVIGCSNPSSSSGGSFLGGAENNGTDISDKIVLANANDLWSDKTQQLLTADSLSGYSSLKITVSNSSLEGDWWVTLYTAADDWEAKLYASESNSETKTLTISDLSACTDGIYITGTWDKNKSYTITILAYK